MSQFAYPFISWWTFGLLPLQAMMNNAAVNIRLQGFVWTCFQLSGIYPTWLFGSTKYFAKNCYTVFHSWLYHFTFPLSVYEGFSFCTPLPTLVTVFLEKVLGMNLYLSCVCRRDGSVTFSNLAPTIDCSFHSFSVFFWVFLGKLRFFSFIF